MKKYTTAKINISDHLLDEEKMIALYDLIGAGNHNNQDYVKSSFFEDNVIKGNQTVNDVSSITTFNSNDNAATNAGNQSSIEIYNSTANKDAFMQFHIAGDYAAYFGLDGSTNDFFVGGYSMGDIKHRVWHSGNDGVGSGLDADKLDGQQGDYYYPASNPNNYTGDQNLSGLMPKWFSTDYRIIPSGGWSAYNLGNGTMSQSGSVGKPSGAVHGYWFNLGRRDGAGGYVGMYVNSYQNSGSGIYIGRAETSALNPTWEQVWTNKTDGSGSGLDADKLDGLEGSEYLRKNTNSEITGALTISGSVSAGGSTSESQYHSGADNLILKGNSRGESGIFFQSEKDGTNINHSTDFGFIQYHSYGTSDNGEANELIIGVSNDSDDNVILNAPSMSGLKFRSGNSATDYTVYHSGNVPTWHQNTNGNAASASKADEAKNNYFYVRGASPSIAFVDTDQGQTRYVHHNGGAIGFLTSAGAWSLRCDDSDATFYVGIKAMAANFTGNVSIGTTVFPSTAIRSKQLLIEGALITKPPGVNDYYSYLKSNYASENAFTLGIQGAGVEHNLITSSGYYLGTGLNFWTSDQKRLIINGSGRVGIGTTIPTSRLHVTSEDDNNYAIRIDGRTNNGNGVWTGLGIGGESTNTKAGLLFQDIGSSYARGKLHLCVNNETNQNSASPSDAKLTVSNDGRVGIGTTSPSEQLDVNGNAKASNFILNSDIRLKEDIKKVENNHIDIDWKTFVMKSEKDQKRYGVIAQELEVKNPEFVRTDAEGMKSVAYIDLLIAKIAELEARLEKAGI